MSEVIFNKTISINNNNQKVFGLESFSNPAVFNALKRIVYCNVTYANDGSLTILTEEDISNVLDKLVLIGDGDSSQSNLVFGIGNIKKQNGGFSFYGSFYIKRNTDVATTMGIVSGDSPSFQCNLNIYNLKDTNSLEAISGANFI